MGITCTKYLGKIKSIMQKLDNEELQRKENLKNATKSQKKKSK